MIHCRQVLADFSKPETWNLALVYGTGNRNVTNGTDMIWEPLTKIHSHYECIPIIYKKKVKITHNLPVNNR